MATVMQPPKPSFFEHDRASTKSRSSSLKDFAMRGRKAFLTTLLGKDNRGSKASPAKLTPLSSSAEPRTETVVTSPCQEDNANPTVTTPKSINAPVKSKSILRRMSVAFQKPATTDVPAVPAVPPLSLQQRRDAALRARGLLPPLHPNKDLSQQELEQDARCSPRVDRTFDDDGDISEANRIKEEWEAKNRSPAHERSQLDNFRFGGLASTENPVASNLEPVVELDSPPPSPAPTRPATRPPPLKLHPATPMGSLSFQAPSSLDPLAIPLPPSPFISLQTVRCSSPTLVPLPASPAASSVIFSDINISLPGSPKSHESPNPRNRSQTLLSVSQGSEESAEPSVYASSHTLSVQTSETKSIPSKPRVGDLTQEIHVIAESPREDVDNTLENGVPTVTLEQPVKQQPLRHPTRRQTEPVDEKRGRRKSLNLFRTPSSSPNPSSKVSMSSFRRSVVGSLYRKDTTAKRIPRSPSSPPVPPSPRLAVAPVMYSRGSILLEASEIEDAESRELTEIAFLN